MTLPVVKVAMIAGFAGMAVAQLATAQSYPVKPVRLVLTVSAGGGMDAIARIVGLRATQSLGQPMVVDARGGGAGTLAAGLVSNAAPDGYTLIMMSASLVARQLLYPGSFDILRDFSPITQVTAQPYLLVTHPSLPIKSLQEFLNYAKAHPGKLNYASSGQGSIIHLATELLRLEARIPAMVHVPYKGMSAGLADVMSGYTQFTLSSIVNSQIHVRSGKLRGLAVTSLQRAKSSPDIPTIAESGVNGYSVINWYGVLAPARTPSAIVNRLHKEIATILDDPELAKRIAADGAEATDRAPKEFADHIKSEIDKWSKVIRESGIKPD
jgi:tripartite-type tricarboxylate transporter receptor subunit TctC